ncbi:MAG TPA: pyridoxamine 5'-phosphate oxidase family protein [Candidatus Omnitrophota bacterium]|nr:pyridoxamine 5'-phosphate oxidase family protein [Candidatus Omnitrophota bacterium]HPT38749.1 pyridoxamine 5'-phosphate oxidase family protein [Candidatus Omnitrophota bacterium]
MKPVPAAVVDFLRTQGFVMVSSIDKNGFPHNSCKAVVKIDPAGEIYLVDVYHGVTSGNIDHNRRISISFVDEHKFSGYCLKGLARKVQDEAISQEMIKVWEDNITSRLTKRLLKNLVQGQGQQHHPEASLPHPKHLIVLEVEEIVDLAPQHLKGLPDGRQGG